ncbi:MAG TPA: aminotransferase class V-fold PLP-dependent enzyme [Polyangiaceae bacterium]|nr:aminotransferase class V-fold PLP-dependent enzyme [Polyangiaceae bacterium]
MTRPERRSASRWLGEFEHLPSQLLGWAFQKVQANPWLKARIEDQYQRILRQLESELHPYRGRFAAHAQLPARGIAAQEILAEMRQLAEEEQVRWRDGQVSGAVYHGGAEHLRLMTDVYALHSQSNPLHADVWPSATKYEAEIVSMTAQLLGAAARPTGTVCGCVSSGGTESILLAMKAYRDRARTQLGVLRPEIVVPETAHAAFDKAAEYFGMRRVNVPVGPDFRADVARMQAAISERTVALVASTPSYPHGVIDPVPELAELARSRGIGLHVDACLGAFLLPFARELGHPVPPFDFSVPGVTSMSADTHKFGYAAKGTSVVLYDTPELRRYQYFVVTDWPGGLYFSPTLSGSRPGALSAACWAALVHLGHDGYLDAARRILDAAARIRAGIQRIVGLRLFGDSLFVITFGADGFDIYRVLDAMSERGWSLNGLQRPACLHFCVTLRQAEPGVTERFVSDLSESVSEARGTRARAGGRAPIYGLAARLPVRGAVADLLRRYVDLLYET